jgi:hypothetical protein
MFAAPTMRSDPQSGMLPNLTNHTKQSREAFRDSFYVVRFFCGVLMPGARTESARLALSGISLVMNRQRRFCARVLRHARRQKSPDT